MSAGYGPRRPSGHPWGPRRPPTRLTLDRAEVRAAIRSLGPWFWEDVRRDPRASIPAYDPITGYETWEELEANPPVFIGLLAPPGGG
jgi:hypothetical protein